MDRFEGKIAVVTGGGTGMGRELCKQLATEGCHVAMCDVSEENMDQTRAACEVAAPAGTKISTHIADVSVEADILSFQSAVADAHQTDHVNLVFNNAGIGGGGSMIVDPRDEWEKTFDVCWYGVYYSTRAFLPMLISADEGHLINTSSVNGFWASIGPSSGHTAYSAAKFAVKGFSEALVNDLKMNAPHVKVSVVMPGHIGTSIVANSGKILGTDPKELDDAGIERVRERIGDFGVDASGWTADQIRQVLIERANAFETQAPMTAAEAAEVILTGVREQRWRILVGDDAHLLDEMVRAEPENAYTEDFFARFYEKAEWSIGS